MTITTKLSLQHIPDSRDCFPIDTHTICLRLRVAASPTPRSITVLYGCKYDFYLGRKESALQLSFTDELFDYYTITLSLEDTRLVYIFRIMEDGQEYFFSEQGVTTEYRYDRSYMSAFQFPFIQEADLMKVPDWYRSAVVYEVFLERFARGNSNRDLSYVNLPWGEIPTPTSYAGGDLKGILDKLDYIRSLGMNTLYLTPIFASPTNHKYAITNYYEIDPQLGTKEELHTLIKTAHGMGMKVMLDAVFNHCHEDFPFFVDVIKRGKDSPYHDWFFIDGDFPIKEKCNYLTFADCAYMPRFNTGNPGARDYLLAVALYWIEEFDIDGWRLDVSDEVSHDFWRRFRSVVKSRKEDCVIIGENWHDASPYLRGDQYDGIMNYGFTRIAMEYFADRAITEEVLAQRLSGLLMRGSDPANTMMLNLLDSHDTHRFFTLLSEDEERLHAALALLFVYPGAPCIYYGTEILLPGGYDPDCRRCMDWEAAKENTPTMELIRRLSTLKESMALRHGSVRMYEKDGFFVLERQYQEEIVKLLIKDRVFEITHTGSSSIG